MSRNQKKLEILKQEKIDEFTQLMVEIFSACDTTEKLQHRWEGLTAGNEASVDNNIVDWWLRDIAIENAMRINTRIKITEQKPDLAFASLSNVLPVDFFVENAPSIAELFFEEGRPNGALNVADFYFKRYKAEEINHEKNNYVMSSIKLKAQEKILEKDKREPNFIEVLNGFKNNDSFGSLQKAIEQNIIAKNKPLLP